MAAMQMVTRMRDHIERIDDGHAYAADDLAVVLRALLCPGRGNDVIRRMFNSFRLPIPETTVSRPARIDVGVFFSVGAIPIDASRAIDDGAIVVSFDAWMKTPVLLVTSSGSKESYTWTRFLNTYANKWGGAHLDPAVPAHLQMIDCHVASGMPLSNYLLRSAAVRTWDISQYLYRRLMKVLKPADMTPEELKVRRRMWEENPDAVHIVAGSGNASPPRDISPKGLLQHFTHHSDDVDILFYIDDTSPDNALRLALGSMVYDVRYEHPAVPGTKGPLEVSSQRSPTVPKSTGTVPERAIPVNCRVRSIAEVRTPFPTDEDDRGES